MPRTRLDHALVAAGLAESQPVAERLIRAGQVLVNDRPVDKPATPVADGDALRLRGHDHPYVSRGGVKLAGALDRFEIHPAGLWLDAGASTGGFTDCLLRHGAERVVAVDVGYGQLAWSLRQDSRVEVHERTHILRLPEAVRARRYDGITCDLAFIALTRVLPHIVNLLTPGGWLVALIKPQFEADREEVGKGGVVRDPAVRTAVIERVVRLTADLGLRIVGSMDAPIRGPKGNLEALMAARRDEGTPR